MNKTEYTEYEAAYRRRLEGLERVSIGACSGCEDCCSCYRYDDEAEQFKTQPKPWFSKLSCEACGSTEAGDREVTHGVDADGEIVHLDMCDDCVYYTEYGQLDDATMEGVEA